jgi:RHS repeat-associated protein
VTDTYNYDAYGNLSSSTGTTVNSYLYAGEQFDKNLGDYYLRDRYYSTDIGRFTQRDRFDGDMMNPLSLNRYGYTHGNPVNGTDPSGMFLVNDALVIQAEIQKAYGAAVPFSLTALNTLKGGLYKAAVFAIAYYVTTVVLEYLLEGREYKQESNQIPTVVWGNNLGKTRDHTSEALSGQGSGFKDGFGIGSPILFRIQFQKGRRTGWRALFGEWYEKEPQCKGKTGDLTNLSCDEYPYNSTAPGGLLAYDLHLVSLKPVDSDEQNTQGGWLNSFYKKAGIVPFDLQKGWYLVQTTNTEDSYWIGRNSKDKNYFKKGK